MKIWFLLSVFVSSGAFAGNSLPEIAQRCTPLSPIEKPLYSGDFSWGYDLPAMLQRFTEIYHSPKRLPQRALWDAQKQILKLPYDKSRGGDIEITEVFIQTLVRHVERAFEQKYVDAVFFPDMGHSHLLIPEKLMKNKYSKYPITKTSLMYQDLFKDKNLEILYHTAEQLQTLDQDGKPLQDPQIQWRHRTRNIVGKNQPTSDLRVLQNPESAANTVSEVPGYYWWGAGFNISSQESGCFEYRAHGKVFYFDLSMYDLIYDPVDQPWFLP